MTTMNGADTTSRIAHETDPLAWVQADPSTSPLKPLTPELRFDPSRWPDPDDGDHTLWVQPTHQTDGTPEAIWHGRVVRWTIAPRTDAACLTESLNRGDLDDHLDRIAAGHTIDWDGHNHVGTLTEDAVAAADAVRVWLEDRCELTGEHAGLWEAGDWLTEYGYAAIADDHDLDEHPTDARLSAVADALDEEARTQQVVLDGTFDWLKAQATR